MDPSALESLARAVKQAGPRAWSRGVLLARDGAVEVGAEGEDEVSLKVRVPERPVALTVLLYPETGEWDCDCAAPAGACAHVAAAVITLTQAREAGAPAAPPRSRPRLVYRLTRGAEPVLERLLEAPDGLTPAPGPLRPLAARGVDLAEADLRLEPLLPGGRARLSDPAQVQLILTELADGSAVLLDSERLRAATRRLLPRALVQGDARELRFTIQADPALGEVLGPGLGRAGDALCPLGELPLCGARWERLPLEKRYPERAFAELALEVVPLYRGRLEVEVRTAALPQVGRPLPPRIELGVEHGVDEVAVAPRLVYGHPPRLLVEDGRPIYLGGVVAPRDIAAERRLLDRLRDELNLVTGRRVVVRGVEAVPFLRKLRDFLAEEGAGEEALPRLVPRLQLAGERFTLDFVAASLSTGAGDGAPAVSAEVSVDLSDGTGGDGAAPGPCGRPLAAEPERDPGRRAEAGQVLHAFAAGHDVVPLLQGGFGELPRAWLAAHHERVALLLRLRGEDGRLPALALPALAELCRDLGLPEPPGLARIRPLLAGLEALPARPLPADLRAELRPYQRRGAEWLLCLRALELGAVLADDMGLGKTLQAIAALQGRALVVCPTSVLPNWVSELERFRPGLSRRVYYGAERSLEPAEVTLTTYALLRSDLEALAAVAWEVVVLDESQAIKNPDSQTARAAFRLQARFRLALTGTPVENRLEELWSQLHFVNPGLLATRTEFSDHFARPIGQGDAGRAARLRERIRPFVLRRLKSEVARELPPKSEMVLHAELSADERVLYQSVLLASRQEVLAQLGQGGSVLAALEALLRLRQACCHPALLPGQSAASSAKIEALVPRLEELALEGHKALVFSQWTALLDLLEPHLSAAGLPFLRLDGSTADRGAVVAAYQRAEGPPLLLISLKAGGVGLNLTQADHVFLLDPWWNPAAEDQAADRAHRIGQERPVMIYRVVARDTVEERILALQARKRALAEAALAEAGQAASLTREDLLGLFE